jgi:hypothetical protein
MIGQPKYDGDVHGYYTPMTGDAGAYEDLSIDGTVRSLSPPTGCRMARLYFRGANIRLTFHGVNPSAGAGIPIYDGYEEWFSYKELATMKFIREGSTNGEVHAVYYR